MRLVHYALLFVCIFIPVFVVITINNNLIFAKKKHFSFVENGLTKGIDSAINSWVMEEGSSEKLVYRDYVITNFYDGLFASFGIMDDKSKQERMILNIPVICLLYEDGFVIRYLDKEGTDGKTKVAFKYSELKPYYWSDENYVYTIINNGRIGIYDKRNKVYRIADSTQAPRNSKVQVQKCISEEMTNYCREYGSGTVFDENVVAGFSFLSNDSSHMDRKLHTNGIIAFYYDKNTKGLFAAGGFDRKSQSEFTN